MNSNFSHVSWLLTQIRIWAILKPGWHFKLFCPFHKWLLSSFRGVKACIVLPGGPMSSEYASAMGICLVLMGVRMVCIKWHPHECNDPGFPSKILHCSEMFSVTVSIVALMLWLIGVHLIIYRVFNLKKQNGCLSQTVEPDFTISGFTTSTGKKKCWPMLTTCATS